MVRCWLRMERWPWRGRALTPSAARALARRPIGLYMCRRVRRAGAGLTRVFCWYRARRSNFGQLAGDSAGDLGLATTSGGNLVSLVRHDTSWTGPVVIASSSAITFSSGVITQNRVFVSGSAGHATFVGFNGPNLSRPRGRGWQSHDEYLGDGPDHHWCGSIPELLRLRHELDGQGHRDLRPSRPKQQHHLARGNAERARASVECTGDSGHVL